MVIKLGHFEVNSGRFVVADPCYELNTETIIMGVLDHVLNGSWIANVERLEVNDWGEACSKLYVYHQLYEDQVEDLHWVKCSFIVGVDSGQAGIFDINMFRIADSVAEGDSDPTDSDWYLTCCDITEGSNEAGVIEGGVVSRTGFGDGAYGAYMAMNEQNQIIGVKIVFIKGFEI